jgi:hypothetical protein
MIENAVLGAWRSRATPDYDAMNADAHMTSEDIPKNFSGPPSFDQASSKQIALGAVTSLSCSLPTLGLL